MIFIVIVKKCRKGKKKRYEEEVPGFISGAFSFCAIPLKVYEISTFALARLTDILRHVSELYDK